MNACEDTQSAWAQDSYVFCNVILPLELDQRRTQSCVLVRTSDEEPSTSATTPLGHKQMSIDLNKKHLLENPEVS